jgi:integrase
MPSLIMKRGKRRYLGTVWVYNMRGPSKLFPDDSEKSYRAAIIWENTTKEEFRRHLEAEAAKAEIAMAYLSIERWIDDYLDFIMANNFAEKTYQEKKAAFARLAGFAGIGPDFPVDEVDRYLCADFFNGQMATRTGNAVNKDRKNLGAAWRWGRDNMRGWPMGENPFLAISRKPEVRQPRYVPPESDFWTVYDYVSGKADESGSDADIQDRVMLFAYLHLAARRSELFKAKWSDVDFSRGLIRLWTRKREAGSLEYDLLPMSAELTNELKLWAGRRLSHNTVDKQHLFVCLSPLPCIEDYYGKPFTKRSHVMERWCKKANVTPFGWHAIRHLTASTLYRRGYSQSHIQAVLRHKSATTTARYLRSMGLSEVRKALDEGLRRECQIIPLQKTKAAPGRAS